jgi:hypothetical protein
MNMFCSVRLLARYEGAQLLFVKRKMRPTHAFGRVGRYAVDRPADGGREQRLYPAVQILRYM